MLFALVSICKYGKEVLLWSSLRKLIEIPSLHKNYLGAREVSVPSPEPRGVAPSIRVCTALSSANAYSMTSHFSCIKCSTTTTSGPGSISWPSPPRCSRMRPSPTVEPMAGDPLTLTSWLSRPLECR